MNVAHWNWKWYGLVFGFVVVLACSASAEQPGLPSDAALAAMGLSGIEVMSDSEATEIRGMGYLPYASVRGRSRARVSLNGQVDEDAGAGSRNRYRAKGKYEASGENRSDAYLEVTDVLQVDYQNGDINIETTTHSVYVEAGGYSSAKAF